MADVEVSNTISPEKEPTKDIFDIVKDDDVGQIKSKLPENNSKEEMDEEDKNDTELLNKIDEAIGLPFQSNGNSHDKDTSQKENDDLLKEDEILNGEELLEEEEAPIDEKTENELLNLEDEEQEQPSVEKEFMELFDSVASPKLDIHPLCEEKKNVEPPDDAGLLDECESPKEKHHDDDTSNGIGSNDDEDSNQNGESAEDENENDDGDAAKKEEQEEISNAKPTIDEQGDDEEKPIENDEKEKAAVEEKSDEVEDDKSEHVAEEKNKDVLIIKDVVSTATTPTEQPLEEDSNMEVNDEQPLNDGDTDMVEDEKEVENDKLTKVEVDEKPSIENLQNSENDNEKENETDSETESKELIKKENEVPVERVKFNFMKKFATQYGKLSHDDLEELLLEKITESLVYRSQCAELRTKYDEQEEIIDRLQKRLSVVTKQYNDLDMIHKRVEKDLKERPDQPIQPVRITRAVGLQVFLEPKNSAYNNTGGGNATALIRPKQMVASTTPTLAASILNHKSPVSIKRLNDSNIKINSEPEPKRKKSGKLITPLRPSLTEKEESSIKMQEASIEQNIRAKINKVSMPVTKYQSTVSTVANGITKKPSPSATSIDLTDDIDDVPSKATHPPALVAIQRGLNNSQHPRALLKQQSNVRSPNVAYRSEPLRNVVSTNKHPAPLPQTPPQIVLPNSKKTPPRPNIKINNVANGIIVSWTVDGLTAEHAEIQCYQIYAYEETKLAPSTDNWKHVGDVKALLLPMAVTLTQFQEGQKYFFAVRAMDTNKRLGQFSAPKTWT